MIEAALKKLDVPPRQVVIEVTIAEVTLTDDLEFGVEWLFKGGAPSGRGSGGNFTVATPFNPADPDRRGRRRQRPIRRSRSRRASTTSSTTRTFPAASRRRCTCSTPTATPRSSPTRTSPRSTTRRRRSRPATGSRSTSRRIVGGTTNARHDDVAVHRHRRAAAGHAAHQRRRARHARRAGRGQRSRHRGRARRRAADQHALGADAASACSPARRW